MSYFGGLLMWGKLNALLCVVFSCGLINCGRWSSEEWKLQSLVTSLNEACIWVWCSASDFELEVEVFL
jgi:hypothetical protein